MSQIFQDELLNDPRPPSGYQKKPSFTNNVLIEKNKDKEFYYLPCYVRFKTKSVEEISMQNLTGTLSGVMILSIFYGELDPKIVEQFLTTKSEIENKYFRSIVLQLSRDANIEVKPDIGVLVKNEVQFKRFDITLRKSFVCQLQGELLFSPFEIINLYLSLTIQPVHLDPDGNQGKKIVIRFNCMDSDFYMKVDASEDCRFGEYDLAESLLEAKYTNKNVIPFGIALKKMQESKRLRQEKILREEVQSITSLVSRSNSPRKTPNKVSKSPKYYQYSHFKIPLYKYPGSSLATIFIPLWILGLATLAVFFQGPGLGNALQNLGTLLLAFIAFIPTIHEKIPPYPGILLVEVLVYLETFTCLLALLDMYLIRGNDPTTYVYDWTADGIFLTALIINLFTVLAVGLAFFIHKVHWEPNYNTIIEGAKNKEFIKETWGNYICDEEFLHYKDVVVQYKAKGLSGSKPILETEEIDI